MGQKGKEVKAVADGVVRYAGSFGDGWGNCVILEHSVPCIGSVTTLYGHIKIAQGIKIGIQVKQGTVLGTIDPDVSPVHLHFGVRLHAYDEYSIRGACAVCGNTKNPYCQPKWPEYFVDPIQFLKEHGWLEVVSTVPEVNGAIGVSPWIEPVIKFNQPLDPATVEKAVKLSPVGTIGEVIPYPLLGKGPAKLVVDAPAGLIRYTDFFFYPNTTFTITVSKELRSATCQQLEEEFKLRFTTGSLGPVRVEIEKSVHHLGNDWWDTPVNTGFVKKAEGLNWSKSFELAEAQLAGFRRAKLVLSVRGSEMSDPIAINGAVIGALNNTLANNGQPQTFSFGTDLLKVGTNTLTINSMLNSKIQERTDFDDFEFFDVYLLLGREEAEFASALPQLRIESPREGQEVFPPFMVRGTAQPNQLIRYEARYKGKMLVGQVTMQLTSGETRTNQSGLFEFKVPTPLLKFRKGTITIKVLRVDQNGQVVETKEFEVYCRGS
jgi:hypothetical protein